MKYGTLAVKYFEDLVRHSLACWPYFVVNDVVGMDLKLVFIGLRGITFSIPFSMTDARSWVANYSNFSLKRPRSAMQTIRRTLDLDLRQHSAF